MIFWSWDILDDFSAWVHYCSWTCSSIYLLDEGSRSTRTWLCQPKGQLWHKRENNLQLFSWLRLMHWWPFGWRIGSNDDVVVPDQGSTMDQKGESLSFFSWMRLMYIWSFGWSMESNANMIVSYQGAAIPQMGQPLELYD